MNGELNPLQRSFIRSGGFSAASAPPARSSPPSLVGGEPRPTKTRSRLDDGQPVPLHRLLQDHRINRRSRSRSRSKRTAHDTFSNIAPPKNLKEVNATLQEFGSNTELRLPSSRASLS